MSQEKGPSKRRYGIVGNADEDKTRCVEAIHGGERWPSFHQCTRKRGFGPAGEYCRIHDPEAVKKRADKRIAEFHARLERELTPHRKMESLESRVAALEAALRLCLPAIDRMLRLLGAIPIPESWRERWHLIFMEGEAAITEARAILGEK